MTTVFEFEEPRLSMTICGKNYTVKADAYTAEICGSILEEAKLRLRKVKAKSTEAEVSDKGICRFFKNSIERLLSPGAVDEIFQDREQNLSDMAELLCFIVARIRDGYLEGR